MEAFVSFAFAYMLRYPGMLMSLGLCVLLLSVGGGWLYAVVLLRDMTVREKNATQQIQALQLQLNYQADQLRLLAQALEGKIEDAVILATLQDLTSTLKFSEGLTRGLSLTGGGKGDMQDGGSTEWG